MLEFLAWLNKLLSDFIFWLHNKEQEAALKRMKVIDKISHYHAGEIIKLAKEKEQIENKYFTEEE